jgi:hypothetical protein
LTTAAIAALTTAAVATLTTTAISSAVFITWRL